MTDEIWQVHHDTEGDVEVIATTEIPNPEPDWSSGRIPEKRELTLTKGDEIHRHNPDQPYEFQGKNELNRTIISDWPTAIAYYLHTLEIHGISEDDAMTTMNDELDMNPYHAMQKSLDARERRLRLLDLLEWRSKHGDDWVAAKYLYDIHCSWQSTDLTDSGAKLAEEIVNSVEVHPQLCYASAGEAAIKHIGNYRVKYAEGIALPKHAGQAIRHAWLLIDNEVAEVTWPWHYYDGSEAVYYGTTIDTETVKSRRRARDTNGPVILSQDEMKHL